MAVVYLLCVVFLFSVPSLFLFIVVHYAQNCSCVNQTCSSNGLWVLRHISMYMPVCLGNPSWTSQSLNSKVNRWETCARLILSLTCSKDYVGCVWCSLETILPLRQTLWVVRQSLAIIGRGRHIWAACMQDYMGTVCLCISKYSRICLQWLVPVSCQAFLWFTSTDNRIQWHWR